MFKRLWFITAVAACLLDVVESGCYQQRLCCERRNNSCFAIEDGIAHLPFFTTTTTSTTSTTSTTTTTTSPTTTSSPTTSTANLLEYTYHPPVYDEQMHRIGQLVYPDVIEVEGSGTDFYERYGDRLGVDKIVVEPNNILQPAPPATTTTTRAPTFKRIVFGKAYFLPEQSNEITRLRRDGLARNAKDDEYSLLNQHIPITVGDFTDYDEDDENSNNISNIRYLETNVKERCHCDEDCIRLGDCCSDYTFVCPISDCYVTNWSQWSACVPNDTVASCGQGIQRRTREVRREAVRGGAECPPLMEEKRCFQDCPTKTQDAPTVALLLDYKFNDTREKLARDNIYWDLPEVASKVEKLSYYCVTYEIGWVNQNCVDKKITAKLYKGNRICAECQPEAQLHRNDMRCASDLEDGNYGFWKLIGPKSCNGIWRRLTRIDNCKCGSSFPQSEPFLLV